MQVAESLTMASVGWTIAGVCAPRSADRAGREEPLLAWLCLLVASIFLPGSRVAVEYLTDPREDAVPHRSGQLPGVGVLPAGMVRGDESDAVGKDRLRS